MQPGILPEVAAIRIENVRPHSTLAPPPRVFYDAAHYGSLR